MVGYCGYSMSNNAVDAYQRGLVPASKISGVPAALVKEFCEPSEWHHSSQYYNEVNFYDPAEVRAVFGLDVNEDYEADPEAVQALAKYRASKKKPPDVFTDCTVEWINWTGSMTRPIPIERREDHCTVSVKGQTATITLPNGKKLVKRMSTKGFAFRQKNGFEHQGVRR